jgi:hypothetical protein
MKTAAKAIPGIRQKFFHSAAAGLLLSTIAAVCVPTIASAASPAVNAHQHDAAAAAPDAGAVLQAIYKVDGNGSDSYDVGKGVTATYWLGHQFELEGKQYFTGFAWETPAQKEGAEGGEAGPEAQVSLSEATFVLVDGSWTLAHAARDIGSMGSYEKPDEVDTNRKVAEYRTPSGKIVLAVPIAGLDNGSSYSGFDIFAFNKSWTHVGYLLAGEDNGAACSDGEVMPCVSSQGEVAFAPDEKSDMPKLVVNFTGTTISAPGETRELGADDVTTYVYDASKKAYESQ